jgi:hypothetical protein
MSKASTSGTPPATGSGGALSQMVGALTKVPEQVQETGAAPKPKRRGRPPKSTADPGKAQIRAILYPGADLLSKLQSVSSAAGGLYSLAFKRLLDSDQGLTQEELDWINLPARPSGPPQAWGLLVEGIFEILEKPELRENPEAQRLAAIFLQLAQLAEMAGTIDIVATALELAHGQRAANTTKKREDAQALEDLVLKLWTEDRTAGEKDRGRAGRVHKALRNRYGLDVAENTVRAARDRLIGAGRLKNG